MGFPTKVTWLKYAILPFKRCEIAFAAYCFWSFYPSARNLKSLKIVLHFSLLEKAYSCISSTSGYDKSLLYPKASRCSLKLLRVRSKICEIYEIYFREFDEDIFPKVNEIKLEHKRKTPILMAFGKTRKIRIFSWLLDRKKRNVSSLSAVHQMTLVVQK